MHLKAWFSSYRNVIKKNLSLKQNVKDLKNNEIFYPFNSYSHHSATCENNIRTENPFFQKRLEFGVWTFFSKKSDIFYFFASSKFCVILRFIYFSLRRDENTTVYTPFDILKACVVFEIIMASLNSLQWYPD